jgi:hypothetical protein
MHEINLTIKPNRFTVRSIGHRREYIIGTHVRLFNKLTRDFAILGSVPARASSLRGGGLVATVTDPVDMEGEEEEEKELLDSLQLLEELRVDQECVCQTFIKILLCTAFQKFRSCFFS